MATTIAELDAREKGTQVPISIATALAIESSLGIMPEQETPDAPILKTQTLWINLRTLVRNFYGAIHKEFREGVFPAQVAELIVNEMQIIESAISKGANGRVEVTYYLCSLVGLNRRYPYAKHKSADTPNQKTAYAMEEATLQEILLLNPPFDLRLFEMDFDDVQQNAFIITHHPLDLLNRYRFKTLTLLESHTGALKPPSLWYTKLQNGRDLPNIPFDRMTLQLFGDGVLFAPMDGKARRLLVELATKNKWSPLTTKDYIVSTIHREREPILEALILRLY